jgi:hypothetical protein
MSSILPTTNLILTNTQANPGTITLPPTSQIQARLLTIKDSTGSFSTNAITVLTSPGDTFEDGTTRMQIRTSFGNVQYVAGTNKWFTIGGTQVANLVASQVTTNVLSTNTISTNTLATSSFQFLFNQTSTGTIYESTSQLYFNSTLIGATTAPSQFLYPGPAFTVSTMQARVNVFPTFTNYTYLSTTGTNAFNVVGTISNAEVLLVGGGGAGGTVCGRSGGGGGAGGFINQSTMFANSNYRIFVGRGGVTQSTMMNGSDSEIWGLFRAVGGSAGLTNDFNTAVQPGLGGSGGGGGGNVGVGTPGQGFNGGTAVGGTADQQAAGGGGGAGSVGSNAATSQGGNGGAGRASAITGTSVFYAGGGGGAKRTVTGGTAGTGGTGGGGNGGTAANGSAGTNGLGGGGGGAGGTVSGSDVVRIGGNGGSGVVIIRVYNS